MTLSEKERKRLHQQAAKRKGVLSTSKVPDYLHGGEHQDPDWVLKENYLRRMVARHMPDVSQQELEKLLSSRMPLVHVVEEIQFGHNEYASAAFYITENLRDGDPHTWKETEIWQLSSRAAKIGKMKKKKKKSPTVPTGSSQVTWVGKR